MSERHRIRVPLHLAALLAVGVATAATGAPAPAGAPRTCQGEEATMVGTGGPDRLVGTPGRDVILALGGRDTVRGRGGHDLVCGGDGADRLAGGPGDDRLHGGRDGRGADRAGTFLVGDVLRGGPGDDLLDLGEDTRDGHKPPDTVAYDEAAVPVVVDLSGESGTATGEGTDTIVLVAQVAVVGSPFDDTVTGTAGDDQVAAGHGDDTVAGGGGDDVLSGDDTLGPDHRLGSPTPLPADATDDDVVRGDAGDDLLLSGVGHDELHGDGDRDGIVTSGTEATSVFGGGGLDSVEQVLATESGGTSDGGPGFDYLTVLGAPYEDAVPRARWTLDLRTGTSSAGAEPVTGAVTGYEEHRLSGRLRWRFFGTPGDDRVWALSGGELEATTYAGDDWMIGTTRADHLDGGEGTDEADGREADDTCIDIERGARTC